MICTSRRPLGINASPFHHATVCPMLHSRSQAEVRFAALISQQEDTHTPTHPSTHLPTQYFHCKEFPSGTDIAWKRGDDFSYIYNGKTFLCWLWYGGPVILSKFAFFLYLWLSYPLYIPLPTNALYGDSYLGK